ncbi:hypothetical protein H4R20_000171 [Coemansia guatemalensis]|uniref:PAS domain-containing protein n=1 Tax=Coemansia guatemalensis TaxID=2761395 RepID=A0A9W8I5S5_9FUNG|nr:hypothetical protein H4R20_000171 [Coemansia guatemalensis]
MPLSYIAVYEREHPERIIFVSSNCQRVLGYTPQEMLGTSAMSYSADAYAEHYSCQWPADNPELTVTMMPHNVKSKDGDIIFTHTISFNCSGYIFSTINAFPEFGRVFLGDSVLYRLQHETNYDAISTNVIENQQAAEEAATCGSTTANVECASSSTQSAAQNSINQMASLGYPQITNATLKHAHVYTARSSPVKACVILNKLSNNANVQGPTVYFATNTINDIYNGNVDAHELVDMPFLSLVVYQDVTKAALFMDKLISSPHPQLCTLRLISDPVYSAEDNNASDTGAASQAVSDSSINVEIFGASSDEKIMLLCQKTRRRRPTGSTFPNSMLGAHNPIDDELPYMSLEEIISSDPETSDPGRQWHQVL